MRFIFFGLVWALSLLTGNMVGQSIMDHGMPWWFAVVVISWGVSCVIAGLMGRSK